MGAPLLDPADWDALDCLKTARTDDLSQVANDLDRLRPVVRSRCVLLSDGGRGTEEEDEQKRKDEFVAHALMLQAVRGSAMGWKDTVMGRASGLTGGVAVPRS